MLCIFGKRPTRLGGLFFIWNGNKLLFVFGCVENCSMFAYIFKHKNIINMETFLILIGSAILYFLPTMVAYDRKSATGIFILNLFFGWTLIGWVAALIWAVSSERNPPKNPQYYKKEKKINDYSASGYMNGYAQKTVQEWTDLNGDFHRQYKS